MFGMILALPAMMWGIPIIATAIGFSSEAALIAVLPLAFAWFIVRSIGSFMIGCPDCGRSVFLRAL